MRCECPQVHLRIERMFEVSGSMGPQPAAAGPGAPVTAADVSAWTAALMGVARDARDAGAGRPAPCAGGAELCRGRCPGGGGRGLRRLPACRAGRGRGARGAAGSRGGRAGRPGAAGVAAPGPPAPGAGQGADQRDAVHPGRAAHRADHRMAGHHPGPGDRLPDPGGPDRPSTSALAGDPDALEANGEGELDRRRPEAGLPAGPAPRWPTGAAGPRPTGGSPCVPPPT